MARLVRIVAQNLRTVRERRGIPQGVVAQRAGVSTAYISLLEREQRKPPLEMLEAIAKALGVPLLYLLQEPAAANLTPERRYEVAVHEAGHALAALHYGFELRPQRCLLIDSTSHRTRDGATCHRSRADDVVHRAVVEMAGLAADSLRSGKNPSRADHHEARPDRLSAARALGRKRLTPRVDYVLAALYWQARAILKRNWSTVLAIASELNEKGSLHRHEVERVYERGARP